MIATARDRPTGITILTMLQIIAGIIEILTGLMLALAYAKPPGFDFAAAFASVPSAFTFLLPTLAVVWFTFAVLSFVFAYAIWSGRGWSWVASMVFATNALTVGSFGLLIGSVANAIPIVVITLVLISLSTYSVRLYLGRMQSVVGPYVIPSAVPGPGYVAPGFAPQSRPPPAPPQAASPWAWVVTCPNCGGQSYSGTSFCNWCGGRLRG